MSDPTSAELEQEVIDKRNSVEETLDALRAKLSSGQILNQVARSFTGAGGQGGELMSNLARQVRDNPLPVALTGVGLAWLLTSQARGQRPAAAPAPAAAAAEPIVEPREGGEAGSVAAPADTSADGVAAIAATAGEPLRPADDTARAASRVAERQRETAERVGELAESVREASEHMRRRLDARVSAEPLVAGVVGVAVGVVLGALLPFPRSDGGSSGDADDR